VDCQLVTFLSETGAGKRRLYVKQLGRYPNNLQYNQCVETTSPSWHSACYISITGKGRCFTTLIICLTPGVF
jgi:hypothetical protein